MKKRVLVYPCGTEIGLEIYRALRYTNEYEIIGGADGYDHGRFVFDNLICGLPFIKDNSSEADVKAFENAISEYNIDFIYPAMDGVIAVFAKYRDIFREILIIADTATAEMCRSKKKTYSVLKDVIDVPRIYASVEEVNEFPVFVKPDQGQGSVGARKIENLESLKTVDFCKNVVMEYLPGKEYTVDCFTNAEGTLIYAKGRGRKRIKSGISVNAVFDDNPQFMIIAQKINSAISQKGGWFFQVREDNNGKLKLLEVAARIAGTSAISRNIGANLPLMSLNLFNGVKIKDVILNDYYIELDRALGNAFKLDVRYSSVYIIYDDTIVKDGVINTSVIKFVYQCINNRIKVYLLTKKNSDLDNELRKYRLIGIFDRIFQAENGVQKTTDFITDKHAIFIASSYSERKLVKETLKIPVLDVHMLECLIKE